MGPVLAKARFADPQASPFKPYVFIGVAYLVWAIAGGFAGMVVKADNFDFFGLSLWGTVFAFAAGTLGALGAFNLTMAMSTGGGKHPQVVMAVVFGGAVTIAGLIGYFQNRGKVEISPMLWIGIIGMGICAIIVAQNTPHGSHGAKQGANAQSVSHESESSEKTSTSNGASSPNENSKTN